MERRKWLLVGASALIALLYPLLWREGPASPFEIAAKGAGVALLGVAAAFAARSFDGRLLALLLGFGAMGDVLLEIDFTVGAAAFAAGHVTAMLLYLRNRGEPRPRDFGVAAVSVAAGGLLPSLLLPSGADVAGFTLYGLLLGGMTATALLSRFPRSLTGLGALLFLASDMMIAWRMGLPARPLWVGLAIWYLYYAGQLMVFLGGRRGIGR